MFNTSVAGSSSQASIVAFDNLYSTCTGTVPQTYWAYDTGGTISTSVVLSPLDGTQVAFIHSATPAQLVLLKWKAGTGTVSSPVTPTAVANSAYNTCTAPCMTTINFDEGYGDTNSSPFYDYSSDDAIYVGDNHGNLHKFSPVFNGTPKEVTSGGWPVAVSSYILTSPVYDSTSKLVFFGDSGGYLYSVPATGGTAKGSSQLGNSPPGIVDGPLVDSTTETVYAFVADAIPFAYCGGHSDESCAHIIQFDAASVRGTGSGYATLGIGSTMRTLYSGAFDNTFYSNTGTTPTGNLYVCAFNANTTNAPALALIAQVPMTLFGCGTPSCQNVPHTSALTSVAANCSPMSEIYNQRTLQGTVNNSNHTVTATTGTFTPADVGATISGTGISLGAYITGYTSSTTVTVSGTTASETGVTITVGDDWVYTSVTNNGSATGCTSGACIYGFNVASGILSTSPVMARAVAGGTSGIIVDNTGTGGGSQVYFTYLGAASSTVECPPPSLDPTSEGCAVQASQAALQ